MNSDIPRYLSTMGLMTSPNMFMNLIIVLSQEDSRGRPDSFHIQHYVGCLDMFEVTNVI